MGRFFRSEKVVGWSKQFPFKNIAKGVRGWFSPCCPTMLQWWGNRGKIRHHFVQWNSVFIMFFLGNIVLHMFMPATREEYDLEMLWTVGAEFDEKMRQGETLTDAFSLDNFMPENWGTSNSGAEPVETSGSQTPNTATLESETGWHGIPEKEQAKWVTCLVKKKKFSWNEWQWNVVLCLTI